MNAAQIDVGAINAELSRLVGHQVELLERRLALGTPAYIVAPVQRDMLADAFWRDLQASCSQGIWESPEAALVGFGAAATAWVAVKGRTAPRGLENALRRRLAPGTAFASDVISEFAHQGVSRDRVGRASRRIGVLRTKAGIAQGWVWALPEGGASARIEEGAREQPETAPNGATA